MILLEGDGVHGFHGGFEYAAREARRELLEEARQRRLARQARGPGRGLGGRLAAALGAVGGWWKAVRAGGEETPEVPISGVPDFVYLTVEERGRVVEIFLRAGGCVVRKTDLRTGARTDSFVADGPIRR